MNSASGPPSPNTEAMTWRTDSGKSPTMIDQQPTTSRATTIERADDAVRTSILNDARDVRTTRDRDDTSTLRSRRSTHATRAVISPTPARPSRHSCTIRIGGPGRRTRATDRRGHDPDLDLAGAGDDPPDRVAGRAAGSARRRRKPGAASADRARTRRASRAGSRGRRRRSGRPRRPQRHTAA